MITRTIRAILAVPVALALAACDTTVTNPGPVQDGFLDNPEAQPSIVAGMGRALAEAINYVGYTGAAVAREIHPSGSTGSFGITVPWQRGQLDPNDSDLDDHWELAQQARWLTGHGIERIAPDPASPELLGQAYLYAGYANRLMGENFCQAVIDGGPAQPSTVFLDSAEANFTKAIAAAADDEQRTAAYAGRASVLADLGDWAGAIADASQVPTDFDYQIPYYDIGSEAQLNRIEWATHSLPYRAHTEWNTWYSAYYDATGDPRVPYQYNADELGDAAIDCCDRVPWWPEKKYASPDAPITLSSGSEMRLIEAEKMLMDGNVSGAVGKINELRAAAGVPLVSTTNLTEAWTALKRERGIVLWLEARRLGDFRRWKEANTPGSLDPLEQPSGDVKVGSHLAQQDLCFPISRSERDTNPNIG